MKVLKEAVYRTVHGEGGLVFIHGEAGIGKTRLLRELGAYARSRGVQVLYGRCPALFRMDGVPPYVLWKEVIKDYLETCIPEQLYRVIGFYPAEVAKLVPELRQRLATIPQSFPISPEQEQNRLLEAVSQFVTNISKETSLLVVLDDLQWTDLSSLLLLHYLARGVRKTPLLLLGAYRGTDIDDQHPLTPVLAELNRERLPQEIQLKRMSLNDVSEMIKNILEQDDIPEEFSKLVYDKTRGNPFFVEEVVKSLKEEEVICREEGKWKFKEITAIELPKSVKTVVKARISRLDEECQNVLTMASFIGNDFTLEAMCAVTGIEKSKLLKLMDKLFKTGLIKERVVRGEGICSFADTLVRDAVYEEVSPLTRKELHGVVGCALEKAYAETIDDHAGELASHFLVSGDRSKALNYFLKAGEKATGIHANAEAASYFQSALRLLGEKEGEQQEKERVLEQLGDIENLLGKYDACMKHWDEALLISTKQQEKQKTATLHRKMANVLWDKIGDKEKAKEHHEAALKILESEPESAELARIYKDAGHMHRRMGKFAEALRLEERALSLAEKLNALEVVADSCGELSIEVGTTGDYKKALEYANRALTVALEKGYWESALWAYYRVALNLGTEALNTFALTSKWPGYEKRMDCIEKGLALAKKIGHVRFQEIFLHCQTIQCFGWGELSKAITLEEEALSVAKRSGQRDMFALSWILGTLGHAYSMLGEWEKSEQYYDESWDVARNLDEYQLINLRHIGLGLLYFSKEEYAKARECFEKAVKLNEEAGDKADQMYCSQLLVWASVELGEVERAQNLLESSRKFAAETTDKYFGINEKTLEAMLLRVQKKYADSIELFEETLRERESIKAHIWDAFWFAKWALFEYARVYLERDEKGDREKADKILNRALEMFQKMGARKDVEKVEARIAFIEKDKEISEPKPVDHVSTGYADLDKLLYGGLPSNHAVVLTTPSCDERDTLIKNFLEAGAKRGEITFYVTTDPGSAKHLAEEFQSNFFLFVCNAQADAIVKDSPNVFKLKGVENLTEIGISLTSAIKKLDSSLKGPRRVCIDLISDILLQHHAVQTRRCLSSLIPELRSEGFTMLALMNPEMHSPQEARAVLDLFDGEINIYEKQTEKGSERSLKVKRMSDQKYLENEILLTKTP
jgi:tetratricopeptide (TPR) repeat protein/KaiC/GvpD/RAD55 family RecA-like ATPase